MNMKVRKFYPSQVLRNLQGEHSQFAAGCLTGKEVQVGIKIEDVTGPSAATTLQAVLAQATPVSERGQSCSLADATPEQIEAVLSNTNTKIFLRFK